jgi:hypothetical protein
MFDLLISIKFIKMNYFHIFLIHSPKPTKTLHFEVIWEMQIIQNIFDIITYLPFMNL